MKTIAIEHGHIDYRKAPGKTVEIVNIEVDNAHRHEGVGRRLLRELFKLVRDAETVYAITRTDNLIAQQFYEKCGFEVTGVLRRFYLRGNTIVDAIMYGRSPKGPI